MQVVWENDVITFLYLAIKRKKKRVDSVCESGERPKPKGRAHGVGAVWGPPSP